MTRGMGQTRTIKSGGGEYPCFPTMGGMLRYERMTGKKYTETDGTVSEALTRLYCLACSACQALGREKPAGLQEFADGISPEDFSAWALSQSGQEAPEGEGRKKA